MQIKVSACNIKQSGITLTIVSAISSHFQTWVFWYLGWYIQGPVKNCEIYSANLPSDCKEYYHCPSQRFHSESLMLNRGLVKFALLPAVMNAQVVQKSAWFECDIVFFQSMFPCCLPRVATMLRQGGKESSCHRAKVQPKGSRVPTGLDTPFACLLSVHLLLGVCFTEMLNTLVCN